MAISQRSPTWHILPDFGQFGGCRSPKMTFFTGQRLDITSAHLNLDLYGWVPLWNSQKNGQLGVKWGKMVKIGQFWPIWRLLETQKWLFLLGKDLTLPHHTSILTFRGEFHLVPAKKMAKWASNWLKLSKMAIFGRFGADRGPQMACSNLFRPNITYPNIFTLIFSKKKEKFFFFEFNNPTSP